MRRRARAAEGKRATELIEEAVHLLRSTPAPALAAYYLGTFPFVLAFLFFWADMGRSPFADRHLAGSALALTGLFFWMKFWQAVFVRRLRAALSGAPARGLGAREAARLFVMQAILQPTGLFVLPLAFVFLLPFAWVYAFYQNLTALDSSESAGIGTLARKAARQASLWPRQNHTALATLALFSLFVFLNWSVVCFLLPGLWKMLFGVESIFSRSSTSLLNTTFFAAMFGLTYLSLDPVLKALYSLRCFYGEALRSGEDLKAELGRISVPLAKAAVCVLVLLAAWGPRAAAAPRLAAPPAERPESPARTAPGVNPAALDQAIQETIQQNKYAWRAPRAKLADTESQTGGLIDRFIEQAQKTIGDGLKSFGRWLGKWLRKLFSRPPVVQPANSSGYGWILAQEILVYVLIAAAAAGLGWLAYKLYRLKNRPPAVVASEALPTAPDLVDEDVGPEQMPEDGWTQLARELLGRGELRLALRAFYLASLARLAARNLITLARFKSNREYEQELVRRAHAFPTLLAAFDENVSLFERVWYGWHEVSIEAVNQFAGRVERLGEEG